MGIAERPCACTCSFFGHLGFGGRCKVHLNCTQWREPQEIVDALMDREIQEMVDFGDQVPQHLSTGPSALLMTTLGNLEQDLEAAGDDNPGLFVAYPVQLVGAGFAGFGFDELAVPKDRWRGDQRSCWDPLVRHDFPRLLRQAARQLSGVPAGLVYADVVHLDTPDTAAGGRGCVTPVRVAFCVDLDLRQYLVLRWQVSGVRTVQVQTARTIGRYATGDVPAGDAALARIQREPWPRALSTMVYTYLLGPA